MLSVLGLAGLGIDEADSLRGLGGRLGRGAGGVLGSLGGAGLGGGCLGRGVILHCAHAGSSLSGALPLVIYFRAVARSVSVP